MNKVIEYRVKRKIKEYAINEPLSVAWRLEFAYIYAYRYSVILVEIESKIRLHRKLHRINEVQMMSFKNKVLKMNKRSNLIKTTRTWHAIKTVSLFIE